MPKELQLCNMSAKFEQILGLDLGIFEPKAKNIEVLGPWILSRPLKVTLFIFILILITISKQKNIK